MTDTTETKKYGGKFKAGYDPRRHVFTREECVRGFQAAEASLQRRFPGCDTHFLMCAIIGSKPWYTLPIITSLTGNETEEDIARLFGRE